MLRPSKPGAHTPPLRGGLNEPPSTSGDGSLPYSENLQNEVSENVPSVPESRLKHMSDDYQKELAKALERILQSKSPKRLIVAGPGTGKTTLFRKLLQSVPGDPKKRLVLTFLNNLKNELEEKLSDLAGVFSFHGYCHFLLRRSEE